MVKASRSSMTSYWGLVLVLIGLGFLAILSIGYVLLVVALTLVLLSPFRSRPTVFLPAVALVIGFIAGYAFLAPLTCASVDGSPRMCHSLVGVEYTGSPQTPGIIGGGVVALTLATIVWVIARLQHHSTRLHSDRRRAAR